MWKKTFALFILSTMFITSYSMPIRGGRPTKKGEYQNIVALSDAKGTIFCTGTLISEDVVITAKHCTKTPEIWNFSDPLDPSDILVHFGSGKDKKENVDVKSLRKIKKIIRSQVEKTEQYYEDGLLGTRSGLEEDIALLILETPEKKIKPQKIAILCETLETAKKNGPILLVGFGEGKSESSGLKREVLTKINDILLNNVLIGEKGIGGSFGDSGGPAFIRPRCENKKQKWALFAITSGPNQSIDNIEVGSYEAIYPKTLEWINKSLEKFNIKPIRPFRCEDN